MSNSDDVGYGRPPKYTQFKKGQSGNPNGRPKGSRNLTTDLLEELTEQILVREGGKSKRISKQRAMLKSLAAKAVSGDVKAATLLLNMVCRLLVEQDDDDAIDLSAEDLAILDAYSRKQVGRGRSETPKSQK